MLVHQAMTIAAAKTEANSKNDEDSGTTFTLPSRALTSSVLPKASATMVWENVKELVPSAKLLKDKLAREKRAGWRAANSPGDSNDTAAKSITPCTAPGHWSSNLHEFLKALGDSCHEAPRLGRPSGSSSYPHPPPKFCDGREERARE